MLIESFLDGELIPAVILWQSATHIFVIDGGHRLSALLAWAHDDYTIQSKPGVDFDEDAKNSAFLKQAFAQALRCPICEGFLDPAKSVSYDHIKRKEDGGDGHPENCQLTHPYCNSSLKG